jgi:hypothetical protein
MSYFDNQRILRELGRQIESDAPLSDDQKRFLAIALYRIGTGEDANKVLGVRPQRGQKLSDVVARRRMSLILHWVAGAIEPDPESTSKPMSVEDACALAVTTIVPAAKAKFPGSDNRKYDVEYITRCWSEPAYAHMRSPDRGWFDPDFPYYPAPEVSADPK